MIGARPGILIFLHYVKLDKKILTEVRELFDTIIEYIVVNFF